jgi:hypothetical protein
MLHSPPIPSCNDSVKQNEKLVKNPLAGDNNTGRIYTTRTTTRKYKNILQKDEWKTRKG